MRPQLREQSELSCMAELTPYPNDMTKLIVKLVVSGQQITG